MQNHNGNKSSSMMWMMMLCCALPILFWVLLSGKTAGVFSWVTLGILAVVVVAVRFLLTRPDHSESGDESAKEGKNIRSDSDSCCR